MLGFGKVTCAFCSTRVSRRSARRTQIDRSEYVCEGCYARWEDARPRRLRRRAHPARVSEGGRGGGAAAPPALLQDCGVDHVLQQPAVRHALLG